MIQSMVVYNKQIACCRTQMEQEIFEAEVEVQITSIQSVRFLV